MAGFVDNNYFGYGKSKGDKKDRREPWLDLKEPDEREMSAIDEAVGGLREAVCGLVSLVDDKVATIMGDLIEPLEIYIGHHEATSRN